jgi:cell division protease FtsH
VAEEITFDEKTTGAGNDIEQATNMARAMVCEWGMSERMGPLAFGKKEGEVFLGRDMASTQTYSEQTAREIDSEVRRIVNEQYERAKKILLERREALGKIADALLEHETLDLADVDNLLAGGVITRAPPPRSPPPPVDPGDKDKVKKGGILGGLGGVPKPEPGKA